MRQNLTRRNFAAALLVAIPTLATATPQSEEAAADPLAAARKQLRRSVEEMEAFDLPMPAEPAFIFKP